MDCRTKSDRHVIFGVILCSKSRHLHIGQLLLLPLTQDFVHLKATFIQRGQKYLPNILKCTNLALI